MINKKGAFIFTLIFVFTIMTVQIANADSERILIDINTNNNQNTVYQYSIYLVKPGDTLYKIALSHGVTIDSIIELNNLQSYLIYPGQRLTIPISVKENNNLIYTIQPGDSLYKIALDYGVTIDSIMELNKLQSHIIYPGQKLSIPISLKENNNIIHTVESGESLYLISIKYNVSIASIKSINNLDSDIIYIGQKLEIPSKNGSKNDSNKDSGNEKYYSLSGKALINNKTSDLAIFSQESNFNNKVFPLNEGNKIPYQENEIIIKYKPLVTSQSVEKLEKENDLITISSIDKPEGKVVKYQFSTNQGLEELIEEYNKKDNILWAEPNYIYYPTIIPDDQYYENYQWGMVNINMEAAWDISRGDNTVIVAVLDTGIIPNHPDLKGNLLQGADFVGGEKKYPIGSYDKTDNDPTDETTYEKGGSHGTHVAGIIGAISNNKIGVAGINWNVKILPIRGLTRSGGTSWDIAEGIYYAIDQGVDIINMSFGSNYDSIYQHEAVKEAVSNGITVIAATGNEGGRVYYPAAYPETIAVGAVGKGNIKTLYSNFGPEVDIVAPGGDYGESIISTWGYYQNGKTVSDYNGMIGTSMAAPHVSGVAALLVASGVNDPDEIKSRLINTARDLGVNGKDNDYGHGLLDAYGALLNKKIESPLVFAASKSDSEIYVKSELTNTAKDGSFILDKIDATADYIITWFDSNNNNIIDSGDYYAETKYQINDNNIMINLRYLPKRGNSLYYRVIK